MINALKAEFKKLLTVRSTYFIFGIMVLLVIFFAGFIFGYQAKPKQLLDSTYLTQQIFGALPFAALLGGISAILLFAHEYRYNTIMYTLAFARKRSYVLIAKMVAVAALMLVFIGTAMVLSPLVSIVGVHLHGYEIAPQVIHYGNIIWRGAFFAVMYGMFALIIIALVRNQIAAIVIYFMTPTTVENILGLLLKDNTRFLPFSALSEVVNVTPVYKGATPGSAAIITLIYAVVGWAVVWVLFHRRDAN